LEYPHQPVMVHEVVKNLFTISNGVYVDGTVGSGGHSVIIGEKIDSKGRLICLDRDPRAVRLSTSRLSSLGERGIVIRANYSELDNVLQDSGLKEVDGILLDLGLSSDQLEQSGRGFSFNRDEPLDMRMDPDTELTARHLVNNLLQKDLEKTLKVYGEEKRARSIAKSIVRERREKSIGTSLELANLVRSIIPRSHHPGAKHPATRTFQALRIAVNKELENLKIFLNKVPYMLKSGGRLVILSYHSLEDRLVKQAIGAWEKGCECPPDFPECGCGKSSLFNRLNKKGIKPSKKEINENPRARSAILRAAERI